MLPTIFVEWLIRREDHEEIDMIKLSDKEDYVNNTSTNS